MRKIIASIFFIIISSIAMACESNSYKVYYLPLEAEFYIPPTRETIIRDGINFEMESCVLTRLFKQVSEPKQVEPQIEDYKGLRIIIRDKKGRELLITADKKIISENKRYDVDVNTVNDVLTEIVTFIKTTNKK